MHLRYLADGEAVFGTAPQSPDGDFAVCIAAVFHSSTGLYGLGLCIDCKGVLDLVPNIRKHPGIILGELDKQVVCVSLKTRFNGNLAVYGSSGSKKTRAFCANTILQSVARKSSLIISEPKSELYEKTSEYLRDQGYTIKVFHLVTPAASDSWNCLSESEGPELIAQLFCDVVTKNTSSGREAATGAIQGL
ncbi:MAG: type IV secretory system conjugative DNA transfer family protein [Oscillospiraceae bacterium]|nr:type IV secretory system conjugative DNA transfer family protein [Oscillospiraceae bacterium]